MQFQAYATTPSSGKTNYKLVYRGGYPLPHPYFSTTTPGVTHIFLTENKDFVEKSAQISKKPIKFSKIKRHKRTSEAANR